MDQDPQGLWMGPKGPPDGAEGSSTLQELEKAPEAGYFSSLYIIDKVCVCLSITNSQARPEGPLWSP